MDLLSNAPGLLSLIFFCQFGLKNNNKKNVFCSHIATCTVYTPVSKMI